MSRTYNTDPLGIQILRHNKIKPTAKLLHKSRRYRAEWHDLNLDWPDHWGGYWCNGKSHRKQERKNRRARERSLMAQERYDDIYEPRKNLSWLLW